MKQWIKKNWTDPVWSKVFSAIIVAILASVGTTLYALFQQIPFHQLYTVTVDYLTNTKVTLTISMLSILLIAFTTFSLITWLFLFGIVEFKFGNFLKSDKFDIHTFINGEWVLEFEKGNKTQVEFCEVKEGNLYYVEDKLVFSLQNINFNLNKKLVSWDKEGIPFEPIHSKETLTIRNYNLLEGVDSLGYKLYYSRRRKK
ncbi:MAG: hypothetical protein HOP08_05860 [Cyclobacteriaceae bacterium]|nr:hypothetical protein [Cyclobacteriaceae bacterium]